MQASECHIWATATTAHVAAPWRDAEFAAAASLPQPLFSVLVNQLVLLTICSNRTQGFLVRTNSQHGIRRRRMGVGVQVIKPNNKMRHAIPATYARGGDGCAVAAPEALVAADSN